MSNQKKAVLYKTDGRQLEVIYAKAGKASVLLPVPLIAAAVLSQFRESLTKESPEKLLEILREKVGT